LPQSALVNSARNPPARWRMKETNMDKFKVAIVGTIIAAVIWVSIVGGLVYAAFHFIVKFW
jgi:hypothetical protein